MNDTKILIEKIKEGIQEKKGKNIIIADLTGIEDTICKYFVICQGNSPSQVSAIVDSIKEFRRRQQTFRHRRTPKRRMGSDGLCRCTCTCFFAGSKILL